MALRSYKYSNNEDSDESLRRIVHEHDCLTPGEASGDGVEAIAAYEAHAFPDRGLALVRLPSAVNAAKAAARFRKNSRRAPNPSWRNWK
jgi:hypothetical protein